MSDPSETTATEEAWVEKMFEGIDDATVAGLSQGDFAALAARIAQVAAQWSADALLPMREYDKTMDPGAVERFAEDILSRVYRLRERAYAKQ